MDDCSGGLIRHIRLRSATALVVSSIVGVGIFTSTGFQAAYIGHPGYIFLLWIVGGVLAFCGALCYGELGAAMPHAGGEYVFLRETYGGAVAFMSAFVSLIAGFSAPIALMAKGFVSYLTQFIPALAEEPSLGDWISANDLIAIGLVWGLILIHIRRVGLGIGFNDLVTVLKVGGILAIIVGAGALGRGAVSNLWAVSDDFHTMERGGLFAALGTSLIYVMFTYSGWSSAAYVAGEMRRPQRDVPKALLLGTGIVVALYLALNAVYLYGADVNELAGKVEVGLVASRRLFGETGRSLVAAVVCMSILGAASCCTIAGPRAYYALGRDYAFFRLFSKTTQGGAPLTALLVQGVVATVIILWADVDQIMLYAGFTLTLFSALAVSCVLTLRFRRPGMDRPFRTWGYPVTPLLFLGVSAWIMYWAFAGRPVESSLALLTVGAGGVIFYLTRILSKEGKT